MQTKIISIEKALDDEEALSELLQPAGLCLKNGGLAAFPTETVYGLGADAFNPKAAAAIYQAKGRPGDNPLIIHIADIDSLDRIAKQVPQSAFSLAKAFWPGPLTMIFRKQEEVPMAVTGGLDTVAVRMPAHKGALALIRAAGGFVAAPSANTSGRPSPTTAKHVLDDLMGKIDMIIDGGPVSIGLESTIVDMTGEEPVILRPGYINPVMLEEVIGSVHLDRAFVDTDPSAVPKAPGMKYRHYAPKAGLTIVRGEVSETAAAINRLLNNDRKKELRTGVLCSEETKEFYNADVVKCIGRRTDELGIARNLYGLLREFDEEQVDQIYSEAFDTPQMGSAIMNRLKKAAGNHIIELDAYCASRKEKI